MRDVRRTVLGRWRARWTDATGETHVRAFRSGDDAVWFLTERSGLTLHLPTHTIRCGGCGGMTTVIITEETLQAGLPPPPGWGDHPLVCPRCRTTAQEVVT